MDPIASAAAAKAVSVAVGTAMSGLGKYVKAFRRPDFDPARTLEAIDAVSLQRALESGHFSGNGGLTALLSSPDFANYACQLVLLRAVGGPTTDLDSARRELDALTSLFGSPDGEASESLFGVTLQAVDMAISATPGVLTPERRTEAVDTIIRSHLGSLARNVEAIHRSLATPLPLAELEAAYRAQAHHRHRLLVPPNFGGAKRVPIEDLFVETPIHAHAQANDVRYNPITYDQFLSSVHRTVLLGDPGGGKSTLSQKIAYDLSGDHLFPTTNERRLTPFLVTLRDYGSDKEQRGESLISHLRRIVSTRYQLDLPADFFELLLLNGRALVIFDGLDELLDTSHRREITEDVESFCNLYPSCPVLVTSRSVGYDEAPLDVRSFDAYRLGDFHHRHVAEYAKKWFKLDDELTADESADLAVAFLADSEIVADLRSNPLMLSLMCNIYKGEHYIPANRPDVYEKCALMLFERWDAGRDIRFALPFESHVRPAMMHLAFAIYGDTALQSGVTRSDLENLTCDYLLAKRFDDEDEARGAAQKFIDFCTGRAWVFSDVGTTPTGEVLFQFTHRTFLEYFTAGYLVRQEPTPERLFVVLGPRVAAAEWDVVAQLAIQMQNRNVESAGEYFISALLRTADSQPDGRVKDNIYSFCARCLGFLVPSARMTRSIVRRITSAKIGSIENVSLDQENDENIAFDDVEPLTSLLCCAAENWPAVVNEILHTAEEELATGRASAGSLVWSLLIPLEVAPVRLAQTRYREWSREVNEFQLAHWNHLRPLALELPMHAAGAVRAGILSLFEAVEYHGVTCLTECYPSYVHAQWFVSIIAILVRGVFWPNREPLSDRARSLARDFCEVVEAWPPPWDVRCTARFRELLIMLGQDVSGEPPEGVAQEGDSHVVEGAALALALLMTTEEARGEVAQEIAVVFASSSVSALTPMLVTRLTGDGSDSLIGRLVEAGVSPTAAGIVASWASRTSELAHVELIGERPPIFALEPIIY